MVATEEECVEYMWEEKETYCWGDSVKSHVDLTRRLLTKPIV